jgi:hypothetical protein
MRRVRNSNRKVIGILERKRTTGDLGREEGIILNWILKNRV